ncbi:MAG TPA: signal peptidase I [Methylomirabilota bacterium]|nr:signal peptidase I [Methylomirabilota bacterium]
MVPSSAPQYLRGMFIERTVETGSNGKPRLAPLPRPQNQTHHWEGDQFPSLSLQTTGVEVDLAPINRPLARDVVRRIERPAAPLAHHLLVALLLMVSMLGSYYLVSRYVFAAVVIKGRSMMPTLNDGERYILNRWVLNFRSPQPGDVVVLRDPGHDDLAVKRIVAGPFDRVSFHDGAVYVNGRKLNETYLAPHTRTSAPEPKWRNVTVDKDCFFVLGDNRGNSEDSRFYGTVHRDRILGVIEK